MPPRSKTPGGHPKSKSAVKGAKRGQRRQPIVRPDFLSDGEKGTRLQKYLATAGVESRRNCEEFIRDGRITVDGKVITNPAVSVHPEKEDVRLDGERLKPPRYRYYLLNKPKGVVCTNRDPAGRTRAIDLVPNNDQRMFTVGRLDENTLGLLLVTNDGALAEHLAHPRYEVVRRYRVQVAGIPEKDTLTELKKGMHFSDGFFRFQSVRVLKRKGRSTFLELELREGKNREIRRLLARAGHKVIQLERVAFGPLRIGQLEVGRCRELRSPEVRDLYNFLEQAPAIRRAGARGRQDNEKRESSVGRKTPRKKFGKKKATVREESPNRRGAARHGVTKKGSAKQSAFKGKRGKAGARGRKK